jgi:cytidylate kinase/thiamine kinase-like enzyme
MTRPAVHAFPAPPGALNALRALLEEARIKPGKTAVRAEHGHFLMQTLEVTVGRRALTLRMAHPNKARWLAREAWILRHLAGSGLTPDLLAASDGSEALALPHHLLSAPAGKVLTHPLTAADLRSVGELLGRLHAESTVSLRLRAPALGPISLMAAFQLLADDVKSYLSRREKDGLPQDLLTVNLSDLMRGLRRYVVAMEHHFLPPPSRVPCHGSMDLHRILRTEEGLLLRGFEHACASDGVVDLAHLCERAELNETQILQLLDGYATTRGRHDPLRIPRLCAWRVVFRLHRAVMALRELQDMTDVLDEGLAGQTEMMDFMVTQARESMRLAINGLMDFTGPARPFSLREVEAMGALIAVEELHLRGSQPVLGIHGPAYTGKTPLAQDLAERLRVPWVGLNAVLRAAAWATGAPQHVDARTLGDMLNRLHIHVVRGKMQLFWDGQDALVASRGAEDVKLAPEWLSDPSLRAALAAFLRRAAVKGAVVEGQQLRGLLPPGAHLFLVWASPTVRAARREAHLSEHPHATDASTPPAADEPAPSPGEDEMLLDGSNMSLPQMARAVLRALVPGPAMSSDLGLSGRPLLFS